MKQTSDFKRIDHSPDFPTWGKPKVGIFAFLLSVLLWIGLFIVFLFVAYTQLFSFYTAYLLNLIHPKVYIIPFWISALVVFFLFPVSLFVILGGFLVKIMRTA